MYMVVILHVLAESGVLSAQSIGTQRAAWLLETAAYSAVNCFGMISGYVSYRETEKPYLYSRFLSFFLDSCLLLQFWDYAACASIETRVCR